MPAGRPLKYDDVDKLEEDIKGYFSIKDAEEKPYTMSGLAYHLGMDRRTLLNYSKKEEFFPTIKKAMDRVEMWWEENLHGNSVTGTIFNLKNNFGWKDKSEVDSTSSDGSMSPKETQITFTPVGKDD